MPRLSRGPKKIKDMTKKELVDALAEETMMQRSTCLRAIEGMMTVMADAFATGNSIYLRGLGTFRVRRSNKKLARDMKTNKQIILPPRLQLKFIPGNDLRKRLNEYGQ